MTKRGPCIVALLCLLGLATSASAEGEHIPGMLTQMAQASTPIRDADIQVVLQAITVEIYALGYQTAYLDVGADRVPVYIDPQTNPRRSSRDGWPPMVALRPEPRHQADGVFAVDRRQIACAEAEVH